MKLAWSTLIILFVCFTLSAVAQSDTAYQSRPVEIIATRLTVTDLNAPVSVSVIDRARIQTATQLLSPHEVLHGVPGVFALNPNNFAQDLRISIRGFGARAAFGIRGIRVFTDGIPEGTPDGQVDVDNLDMGVVRQVEVVRGAASGLYGNAAGGVIYLTTENPVTRKPLIEFQAAAGSFGYQRYQLKIGQQVGKLQYLLSGAHQTSRGYRDWSRMSNLILNGKLIYQPRPGRKLSLLANFGDSPRADDPGALTADAARQDPRAAGANNLLFETGEAVRQYRLGATYEQTWQRKHQVQITTFHTSRRLRNRLAIASNGFGDLQRQYQGLYLNYQFTGKIENWPYRLKAGIDADAQADTRQRFAYIADTTSGKTRYLQGNQVLHQLETFRSLGFYLLQEIQPLEQLTVTLTGRFDNLNLQSADRYLNDGDQSGKRHFTRLNPSIGINYRVTPSVALYGNYANTYETPSLNELSNNPAGTGGFNPALSPQEAQSLEIGCKGFLQMTKSGKGVKFDLAIFQIESKNDLAPYQIEGQPGKTYFRNIGQTRRRGIEIGASYPLARFLKIQATHTFSDFTFKKYLVNTTDYSGKFMPGIPRNSTQLELRYTGAKGLFFNLQTGIVQKVYANDANSAFAAGYKLINLRIGKNIKWHQLSLEPYLGLNNITDASYMANVQLNAANDRFFEPGAGIFGRIVIKIMMNDE
ncbi:MAG: TonB-dependent receptor [Saprospiraceae bacterium]|nr:TonB-dependent receptor [Saprospiraceae bacterium]